MTSPPSSTISASSRKVIFCSAIVTIVAPCAQAARINYEFGLSALHSDNLSLTETNQISESVLLPQLRFGITQNSSRLQINADGGLQYLDYINDRFDDDLRGDISGRLRWNLLNDRIDFIIEDYLRNQPVSVLNSYSPSNSQQTNVFFAGPSMYLRLSERTRGQLDLRYSQSYAEQTETFNGDRYQAAVRVAHATSEQRTYSASVEASKVTFDISDSNADYSRYDAYFGVAQKLKRFELSADIGYTQLELTDIDRRESSPFFNTTIKWSMSSSSSLAIDGKYQFSDAALDVQTPLGGLDTPILGNIGAAAPVVGPGVFKQTLINLEYQYLSDTTKLTLGPRSERIRYEDGSFPDQMLEGGFIDLQYKLTPRTTLYGLATELHRSFEDLSRTDRDRLLAVGTGFQFTRHLSARLDFQHRERDSSLPTQSYSENAVTISINFRR